MTSAEHLQPAVRVFEDDRGMLGVSEFSSLPFSPQRFFWLCGVGKGENRAGHGHKTCHQFLICLQGSLRVTVSNKYETVSDQVLHVGESLHLLPRQWLDLFEFSADAVLGVYADQPYDFDDYIVSKDDL
jgi:hypothetical protein